MLYKIDYDHDNDGGLLTCDIRFVVVGALVVGNTHCSLHTNDSRVNVSMQLGGASPGMCYYTILYQVTVCIALCCCIYYSNHQQLQPVFGQFGSE